MSKNLHSYLYKDCIFVYSDESYALYGFRGFHAALFLFMQDTQDKEEVYKFIESSGNKLDDKLNRVVIKMLDLINGVKTQEIQENKKEFSLNLLSVDKRSGLECKLQDWSFFLSFKEHSIEKIVRENFKHLLSNSTQTKLPSIDIDLRDNLYIISINGTKMKEVLSLKYIVPVLQDMIRLLYYHSIDYLITLHSAALEYEGKALVLPAVSGSGKSTLSAHLMHNGFNVFSDELTIIKKDTCIVPLPFALSIKEGSWKVLESFIGKEEDLTTHYRFDGQKIHLFSPRQMANENISLSSAYVIFPKYIKGTQAVLSSIDVIEALELISKSQYHIADYKDVKQIESWLNILSSCKIYSLFYGNLEEAKNIIQKVMSR